MYDETDMYSHASSTIPILQHCHRNETVFPHCTDGLHVTVNNILSTIMHFVNGNWP
jgi:hypothetical protein